MIWFTSDTHFDHANILKYTNRPFATVEEMNEALVENWNNLVQPGDVVYHLGDFAFHNHATFAKRLNGQIVLIEGSHDRMSGKDKKAFTWAGPLHVVKIDPEIVLSHYAMRTWPKSHYGTWHLYGHSHGNLPPLGKSFDVGVDAWDLKPINIDQVRDKINSLPTIGILLSCRPNGSGLTELAHIEEYDGMDKRYVGR
jgi:calcineurin-like phosphoesterase family protein